MIANAITSVRESGEPDSIFLLFIIGDFNEAF